MPSLTDALALATLGLKVFPLQPGKKIPLQGSRGYLDATNDPEALAVLWDSAPVGSNIGVAVGASGLMVMDLDVRPEHDGTEALAELEAEHGEVPRGPVVLTPSGGRHHYFRGVCKSGNGVFAKGIDVKSEGGYVLAPPSIVDGRPYVWEVESHISDTPIPDLSTLKIPRLDTPPAPIRGDMTGDLPKPKPFPARPGDIAQKGKRNGFLASIGGKLRRDGASPEELLAELRKVNASQCRPPLHDREVESIARSISRYEAGLRLGAGVTTAALMDAVGVMPQPPKDCLPLALGDMADDIEAQLETPYTLGAMLLMGMAAGCVHGGYQVRVSKDHAEPLCLWMMCALPSGTAKTPAMKIVAAPLFSWQYDQKEKLAPKVVEGESRRKSALERVAALRKKVGTAKDTVESNKLTEEIVKLESELPEVPVIPRVIAQDCTVEALIKLMAQQGERLLMASDEGGLFDAMLGRYQAGFVHIDAMLKAYSASPIIVDRAGADTISMMTPALSVVVSPQPLVSKAMFSDKFLAGKGFLARFCYSEPETKIGRREFAGNTIPRMVEGEYGRVIRALLDTRRKEVADLALSPTALSCWREFRANVEKEMRPGGQFYLIQDWAGKAAGLALRFAGVFHCVRYAGENPEAQEVEATDMLMAIDWVEFFAREYLRSALRNGDDEFILCIRALVMYLRKAQWPDSVRKHYLSRDLSNDFGKETLERVFKHLKDLGWMTETLGREGTRGRNTTYLMFSTDLKNKFTGAVDKEEQTDTL